MASSSYGVLLKKETAPASGTFNTIGSAVSIDLPEYITDALESTSHASSGVREFITSGLRGISSFSATYLCDASFITLVKTDMRAKTISLFSLTGVGDFASIKFNAFFKSFQILGADATNPDAIKVTIEMQPTGSLTAA